VGATGTIGGAVARTLFESGHPVVAVAPQAEDLAELRRGAPEEAVTPLVARVLDDADAARLAATLRALERPLGGVVVAIPQGRSADANDRGRLLDQSAEDLFHCLSRTVLAQHALARHLIPLLAESGRNASYVIVGGAGSETPWAGYGQRSVGMAATRMLARVLHEEARPAGVRVQLLSIDSLVRGESPGDHECPEWPSAGDVARRVLQLIDRDSSDEPAEAVVACTRARSARTSSRVAVPFRDVPSFLDSLRIPTGKSTPQ
jgi:NAD(P)-dependent dehydrogenase (short-subunit alcohol dehydrogenase family)